MARNQKLTNLIINRKFKSSQLDSGKLQIEFSDGSHLFIKTTGEAIGQCNGKTIEAVQQKGTELKLLFSDNTCLIITTIEPTACVLLRDRVGVLEYAD